MGEVKKTKTMINDLTVGSVPKNLLKFAIPFVLANLLQYFYNLVDMIIMGRFVGPNGLAAVSIGGEFMLFFTFIALGMSQAGQVIIAQYVGAGKREKISTVIGNMFSFILSIAIVTSIFSFGFARQFAALMNTPDECLREVVEYSQVCAAGLFFVYGYNIVSNIMRGLGDSKRPLYFVAIAAVINLILDVVFVAIMHMSAKGAALATVIGQAFSFIISIIYLYRRRESFGFTFRLSCFMPDKETLKMMLKLGIPACLQNIAVIVSMLYVAACINSYGVIYSAVTAVSSKVSQVCNIVTLSLNAAGSAMIGQNFGARKHDRVQTVYWYVLGVGAAFCAALSVLVLAFPTQMLRLFNDDPEVLIVGMEVIPVIILNFFGSASRAPSMAFVNGIGFAGMNFVMGIMDGIVVRIGLALLFGKVLNLGVHGYWYGNGIAGYMYFLVILPYLLSGAWKKRKPVVG